MDIIDELENRGYIEQLTHREELKKELNKGSVSFYIGKIMLKLDWELILQQIINYIKQ